MLDRASGDFSAAAVQLIEAAYSAQAGDCETAKAHISHALAIFRDRPIVVQPAVPPLHSSSVPKRRGGFARWQARRLREHIDANLDSRLSVADLAIVVGLSSGYFWRTFKCTFGIPPHAYITRRRIELAQRLMLTTSTALSQIALACGMSDQAHFSRSFRQAVGETPRNWRRNRLAAFTSGKHQPVVDPRRPHPAMQSTPV
jgi:AraC family transcriptional regulator